MARPRSRGLPAHTEIGARIAHERDAAGLTQAQLAVAVGLDQAVISRIESGDTALTAHRAAEIAKALGISIGRLYGEIPAAANG